MTLSLIQIAHAACDEMGVTRPSSLVGSNDAQAQQLLALANREGKELSGREGINGGWPQLRKEHTATFVASQANYAFPSDLQYFMNTTAWDRSQHWPLHGPVSPQAWQVLKSGTIGSIGPRRRFRIMAGEIYFDPTPTTDDAGNTFAIEYYSDAWCQSSVGAAQSAWSADGDLPKLPEDCFVLGLIWRFRKAKGLDWESDFMIYESTVSMEIGRSGMAPILSMAGSKDETRFLDESNIPDAGYGV